MLPAGRCWLLLGSNPAGVEFQWQCRWHIWPCLVSDWLAGGLSEQTQPTTRLACSNGQECYRLGDDCKQFRLSDKPGVAGLNCGGWLYNERNFTLLYLLWTDNFYMCASRPIHCYQKHCCTWLVSQFIIILILLICFCHWCILFGNGTVVSTLFITFTPNSMWYMVTH